jgi:tripartite-type tricarboxylate transporter receptor subunit TctC
MRKTLENLLFLGLLAVVLAIFMPLHQAMAEYPEKPLTIVEPWPAGSAGDSGARILAQLAQEKFGKPIVVQNVVGGGGAKAALFARKAKSDGYTILNSWVANLVMRPIFDSAVGYSRHDFEPIILYQINPFTLVVKADHPAKNLDEFVKWAKAQSRNLNVGICAAVGLPRVVMQRFLEIAEIDNYNPVPFPGCETENIKGLFDGSLDFSTGALAVEKIYGKLVRTLGIFMDERSPLAPHIPTAKEQGYDPRWGVTAAGWSGLVAPPGTPKDRMQKLIDVFGSTAQSNEFLKKCSDVGITVKYLPTGEFRQLWEDSHNRLKPPIERLLRKKKK